FNTSRSAVSSSLEHAADVVRDLEVLPRTDDERPHRRARSADLRVRLAGAVARGVEGDTEEAEAVRGTPSDLRGVLPHAAREDEHVEAAERRSHRRDRAAQTVQVDRDGEHRVLVAGRLRLEDRGEVGLAGQAVEARA